MSPSLEKEIATHSGILTWEIPWAEEPGGLYSLGSQELGVMVEELREDFLEEIMN